MKKLLIPLILAAVLPQTILALEPADNTMAQEPSASPYYFSVFVGPNVPTVLTGSDSANNRIYKKNNTGYDVGASFGYIFSNSFRAEASVSHLYSTVDELKHTSVSVTQINGSTSITPFMLNGLIDITQLNDMVVPYFGLGIGLARIDEDITSRNTNYALTGIDTVLAYQAIAGIKYKADTQLTIGIDYRYFITNDAEMQAKDSTGTQHNFKESYRNHMINLSIQYQFG